MNMLDWARQEVEIACRKENPNKKEGEFDYGCACYGSALKAFESLCEDGHSGFSIKNDAEYTQQTHRWSAIDAYRGYW